MSRIAIWVSCHDSPELTYWSRVSSKPRNKEIREILAAQRRSYEKNKKSQLETDAAGYTLHFFSSSYLFPTFSPRFLLFACNIAQSRLGKKPFYDSVIRFLFYNISPLLLFGCCHIIRLYRSIVGVVGRIYLVAYLCEGKEIGGI